MKGYNFPFKYPDMTPEETNVLVGCRRCRHTWYEKMMIFKDSPRINSASYRYDCCDACKTAEDEQSLKDTP